MGNEEHGLAIALPDVGQQLLHDLPGLRVQGTEGFIHEQHFGIAGQRASDRGSLLHATREHLGIRIREAVELHEVDELARCFATLRRGDLFDLWPELDIAPHRQPGIKRVGLEHHAAVGARFEGGPAVDHDLTLSRGDQPRRDHQQCRLAAARGPDDARELAVWNGERDAFEGGQLSVPAPKAHGDVDDLDLTHARTFSTYGNATRWTIANRVSVINPKTPMVMMAAMIRSARR